MTDVVDAPFWHITADPFSARSYDWERWASEGFRLMSWAPAALQRVTDDLQFERWGFSAMLCAVFDLIFDHFIKESPNET